MCNEEATTQLLVANLDDERNTGTQKNFCEEHLELGKKQYIVNQEIKLSDR